jgi:hypothetical protein
LCIRPRGRGSAAKVLHQPMPAEFPLLLPKGQNSREFDLDSQLPTSAQEACDRTPRYRPTRLQVLCKLALRPVSSAPLGGLPGSRPSPRGAPRAQRHSQALSARQICTRRLSCDITVFFCDIIADIAVYPFLATPISGTALQSQRTSGLI